MENKSKISAIAHNLFRFDFFFVLEGIRAGVWRTKDISIGEKNASNINYVSIGNQIMFIDTIEYFQQSLGVLACNLTKNEKLFIRKECESFIKKNEKSARIFN